MDEQFDFWADSQITPEIQSDLSIGSNFRKIFEKCIIVPNAEIQLDLLAIYACLPSQFMGITPYLYLEGPAGSGKSAILKILGNLSNNNIYNQKTSPAAIRNIINSNRFPDNEDEEENFIFIWDNLGTDFDHTSDFYNFLCASYDRRTANIAFSAGLGETIFFNGFCPKAFSTVWSLLSEPKMSELSRRSLVLKTEKIRQENINLSDLWDVDTLNLIKYSEWIKFYWHTIDNQKRLSNACKQSKKALTKMNFESDFINTYKDFLAVGVTIGIWPTLDYGAQILKAHFDWLGSTMAQITLEDAIKSFLTTSNLHIDDPTDLQIDRIYLDPKRLTSYLKDLYKDGVLDSNPISGDIKIIMKSFGWELMNRGKGILWYRSKSGNRDP